MKKKILTMFALFVVVIILIAISCSKEVAKEPKVTNLEKASVSCTGIAAWSASTIYQNAGMQVQYNCNLYQNNWYSQNQNPATNSGPYQVWTLLGSCTGCTGSSGGTGTGGTGTGTSVSCSGYPVWNSQVVYNTTGQLVEYNCKLYKDVGFAYNLNPETNSGPYQAWSLVGTCSNSDCANGEGPFTGCGNYDKWVNGSYTVYNNVWGGAANTQCLTAYSYSNWNVVSTQPATSGVKSYPNSGFVNLGKTISSLGTLTSSFNVTLPAGGDWEAAYDIWVPSEIMLWMNTHGNVGPIAASWDATGKPVPSATNITVGGHTWNVYHGGNNVVSFVRTSNTTTGTVDIKAIINWIKSQGWISDGTIGAVQFGFEISGTGNIASTFTCNSFSITSN